MKPLAALTVLLVSLVQGWPQFRTNPALTLDPQGFPTLRWELQSNWVYRVESVTNLGGLWTTVPVPEMQLDVSNGITSARFLRPAAHAQFYRLRAAAIKPFGTFTTSIALTNTTDYLNDLGASWARCNIFFNGADKSPTNLLEAGLNLVVTFQNQDPSNIDTTYGNLTSYPKAGFPFLSASNYEKDVLSYLAPISPYLALGQQVWVQAENEVADVTHTTNSIYWCGTINQYLSNNLATLYQSAHAMKPPLPVVLTSFSSANLDLVSQSSNVGKPEYNYQTNFFATLLDRGAYDAADLHFYGQETNIPAKIQWLQSYLPAGKRWISTENGGPDSRVPPYLSWTNTAAFEAEQSNQVPARLAACVTNGAAISLWFSLYDLQGDSTDIFGHLGLLPPSTNSPIVPKPAYYSFKNFTGSQVTISLGPRQPVFQYGHPDAMGLYNVPDQHLAVLQHSSNSYLLWITGNIGANGGSVARLSTTDFLHYANAGPGTRANAEAVFTPSCDGVTATCLTNIDADYVGPNAVITAANGRDLLMFYEAGNKTFGGTNYSHGEGEYNVIALARSTDAGLTWTRQGAVLSGPDPHPAALPGTSQPGISEPGLIVAGGFYYMFFQYIPNQPTEPEAPSVIQAARAPVSSDGAPGTWHKYYQHSFSSEPGLGGRADTIVATGAGTGCTRPVQVWPAFSTYLSAYVLLFLANEGWFFCTSTDLVTWSAPSNFMAEAMWQSCQPMDWNYIFVTPGNPPSVIGQTGYVLFAHTDSKGLNCSGGFSPHELWYCPFTFGKAP